ncbi:hypothetical protein ACWDOR_06510 [Streptosporangium canum]|uniref:hypothetical protein n=1 Tax=Streptosporangium canum TaxID=324952 RepID=UPI00368A8695
MIDIVNQITTTQREVGNQAVAAGEGRAEVRLAPGGDDIATAVARAGRHLAPETSGDR